MPKLPGIHHLNAVKALERAGFRVIRQSKHIVMFDGRHFITIPRHSPVNAITMGGIVRDAGLTIEEFKKAVVGIGLGSEYPRASGPGYRQRRLDR